MPCGVEGRGRQCKTLQDCARSGKSFLASLRGVVQLVRTPACHARGRGFDGMAKPFGPWACFHTSMFKMDLEGTNCGIIARTIGGPYAVLIAEQLQAAGAKLIIGLTSAGRVSPDLLLPCLVVATSAIRDEGTSYP